MATVPSSFSGTWFSDAFARDTDALTRALQKSLYRQEPEPEPTNVLIHITKPESVSTSGSEPETVRKRVWNPIPNGKISKRKSRATKRSATTYITADPANFRQMVQQVTGTGFGGSREPVAPLHRPEPKRAVNRILPTLDTSAFFMGQEEVFVGPSYQTLGNVSIAPECAGLDSEDFPIFPTLESWHHAM